MAKPVRKGSHSKDQSPAGAPAEQAAVDRRWRFYASVAVGVALVMAIVIGLVVIPGVQR